jgi:hypothetical protein
MQIEETEKLKQNLIKSREKSSTSPKVAFSVDNLQRTNSVPNMFEPTNLRYVEDGVMNEEVMVLKNQLKESNLMVEELKLNFRKHLVELQTKLQECVEDKERMQLKK